jgi:hypothetical protein
MSVKKGICCFLFLFSTSVYCFPLTRVILSTDANSLFIHFWPIMAKAWKEIIGVKPTLALIADQSVTVDKSLGDVIRINPIPGIPTSIQAQVVRVLLPILFEDDFCITADIDMIPLRKHYFFRHVQNLKDTVFVVYRDKAYDNVWRYPICYLAAKGTTFRQVIEPDIRKAAAHNPKNNIELIRLIIQNWAKRGYRYDTDELMITKRLDMWHQKTHRLVKLGHGREYTEGRRLAGGNRIANGIDYNKELVAQAYFVDAHCERPYKKCDQLLNDLIRLASVRTRTKPRYK